MAKASSAPSASLFVDGKRQTGPGASGLPGKKTCCVADRPDGKPILSRTWPRTGAGKRRRRESAIGGLELIEDDGHIRVLALEAATGPREGKAGAIAGGGDVITRALGPRGATTLRTDF